MYLRYVHFLCYTVRTPWACTSTVRPRKLFDKYIRLYYETKHNNLISLLEISTKQDLLLLVKRRGVGWYDSSGKQIICSLLPHVHVVSRMQTKIACVGSCNASRFHANCSNNMCKKSCANHTRNKNGNKCTASKCKSPLLQWQCSGIKLVS